MNDDEWAGWYANVLEEHPAWVRATSGSMADLEREFAENQSLLDLLKGVRKKDTEDAGFFEQFFRGDEENLTLREVFEHLNEDSKEMIREWIEIAEPRDDRLPDEESIIPELGEIVIGVAGDPGRQDADPPEDPPADIDVMEAPPSEDETIAATGVTDPYEAVPEEPEVDVPIPGWDTPDEPSVNITLPNDNVATVTGRPGEDPEVHIPGVTDREPDVAFDGPADPTVTMGPAGTAIEPGDAELRGCLPSPVQLIGLVVVALLLAIGAYAVFVDGGDEDADTAPPTSGADDSDTDSDSSDSSGGLPVADDGPVDISDGTPDAPIVLNPCDLLDDAFVQGASGTPWSGVGSEVSNGNRQICEYYPPPTDEGGQESVYIQMEATLNSNSDDFFIGFQDRFPTLLKSLEWGRGGNAEIRQSEGFVSLWGHVIADDPLGRDLFVWISIGNIDAAGGTAAAEEIGVTLRGELLANQ